MSLSKIQDFSLELIGSYLAAIYNNPIRTKSLTSCVIASLGNVTSQIITGNDFNFNSLAAFSLFGLLFGGAVPHTFYLILDKLVSRKASFSTFRKFLIERLIYAPLYQVLSLYMLARFEGKDHDEAFDQMKQLLPRVIRANYKFLSLLQFVNLWIVPPMFRVLVVNLIGFFWSIYLASTKNKKDSRASKRQ